MAIINGHNLRWRVGGVAIGLATNCSISISGETRSLAHKDIGSGSGAGWDGTGYGTKSWEGSCDAYYEEDGSFETLWTAFDGNTVIAVEFSDDVTGNKRFYGNAVITNMEQPSANNEEVTFNVSFRGDGPLLRADQT